MKKKNKNEVIDFQQDFEILSVPNKKEGKFEEGYDKLGRPYEKKTYSDGYSVKKELLKNGKRKITFKEE